MERRELTLTVFLYLANLCDLNIFILFVSPQELLSLSQVISKRIQGSYTEILSRPTNGLTKLFVDQSEIPSGLPSDVLNQWIIKDKSMHVKLLFDSSLLHPSSISFHTFLDLKVVIHS